ncbi:hypothetical protein PsorP6_010927 [Peronosclerospora sorghi]|uniref:Uncharacterized protein n=1 Tax=Peronosclerospora sorghi TaxID=230839 RepID=A0ACC0VV60_9STRA|nr:hypothetical protein PsorP6_010927 [Peronosclerospora sorghi]
MLEICKSVRKLKALNISNTEVSDTGTHGLAKLKELRILHIDTKGVTSNALMNVACLLHMEKNGFVWSKKAESGSSSDQSNKIYFTDVLTFEYLNDAQLLDVLTHLELYSGIWATIPRSAIAVSNAVNKLELELKQEVFKKLQSMPVFSVGSATSRELLPLGVICKGDDAGSADMLSEYLHHNGGLPADCKEKPMMFLCGDKRRDVLPYSFRSRELVVYQTCALQNIAIPDECRVPDWVVFFSRSGLEPVNTFLFLGSLFERQRFVGTQLCAT